MPVVGIVVFAFALRGETPEEMRVLEPNPCNIRLGIETLRIAENYPEHLIVSQWEVAKWLGSHGVAVDSSVELREDGSYLNSQGVWDEAKALFKENGIEDVILIAQPALHLQLWRVRSMARKDGFHVIKEKIYPIYFDESKYNSQPWTKGAMPLLVYAIKQQFGKKGGHDGQQTA